MVSDSRVGTRASRVQAVGSGTGAGAIACRCSGLKIGIRAQAIRGEGL